MIWKDITHLFLPCLALLICNKNRLSSGGAAVKTMWRGRGGHDDDEVEVEQISGE